MSMEFDPNSVKKPTYNWATYIPSRNPKFKVHKQRNFAKNAFHYRKGAILYEWVNGRWVEIFRIENLSFKTCQECGSTEERKYRSYDGKWIGNEYKILCYDCRKKHGR